MKVYIPHFEKYISYHTDIFHYVMDHFRLTGNFCHPVIIKISNPKAFFRRFYSKRITPSQIIYRLSYEILMTSPSNKYFITINKLGNLGENKVKTRKLMNEFIRRLRQRTIGRRKHAYLSGFVVEERGEDGSYHYHIILSDPNNLLTDDINVFKKQVELTLASLNKTCFKSNYLTGNALYGIPKECCEVGEYYLDRLEQYVTKNFESMEWSEASDSIGIVTKAYGCEHQDVIFP